MLTRLVVLLCLFSAMTYAKLDSRVFVRADFVGTAEVELRGGELDFGDVIPGEGAIIEADTYDRRKVELIVKGNGNRKMNIEFPEEVPLYNSEGNVVLYTPDIKEKKRDKLTVPSGSTFYFDSDDEFKFYIGGRLDSYTTTKMGSYTGDFLIEIRYDDK